ncbi:hypothetical protein ATCC90586_002968 [Pythium insidiosum]|nr:hypothetical protein ATCC90586_002968 [Pythium insidiosum]
MATASSDKKYYILRYEYVPDILEKRGPFRAQHLENALALKAEGKIVMGGALAEPAEAIIVFHTSEKSEIEEFVKKDPYVQNKLVTAHSIREWMVAI